jgi:hypothetical protein
VLTFLFRVSERDRDGQRSLAVWHGEAEKVEESGWCWSCLCAELLGDCVPLFSERNFFNHPANSAGKVEPNKRSVNHKVAIF